MSSDSKPKAKPESKADWRALGKGRCPSDAGERSRLSARICEQLGGSLLFKNARHVALFSGLPWEPDLAGLWKMRPEACCFPVCNPSDTSLRFFRIGRLTDLKKGFAGIFEPFAAKDREVIEWTRTDLVLVPGRVFDSTGGRVGSGLGYYDRFLPRTEAFRMGVAFSAQIVSERLAQEATDVRMAGLCTELGISLCSP